MEASESHKLGLPFPLCCRRNGSTKFEFEFEFEFGFKFKFSARAHKQSNCGYDCGYGLGWRDS